jgi:hypothetical protein
LEERKPSHLREIEHQQKHINPFSFALMIHLLHYKKIAQTLMKSTNFNYIYIYKASKIFRILIFCIVVLLVGLFISY